MGKTECSMREGVRTRRSFMKNGKRMLACLLMLAMMLSLLTACGGDGGSTGGSNPPAASSDGINSGNGSEENPDTPPNPTTPTTPGTSENPNNPGSSQEPDKDDEVVEQPNVPAESNPSTSRPEPSESEKSDDKDSGGETAPSMIPIDEKNSKYYQFINKIHKADEAYEKHIEINYDYSEKRSEYEVISAHKGKNTYTRCTNGTKVSTLYIESANENKTDSYRLYERGKAAIKSTIENSGESLEGDIEFNIIGKMYATMLDMDGEKYYTEIFLDSVYDKHTVCFDSSGNPIYIKVECRIPGIKNHEDHFSMQITKFQTITFNSNGICKVPEDYTVYTTESISSGIKITDTEENSYIYNMRTRKVTDEDENDVTEQFRWFVNMMNGSDRMGSVHVWAH